MRKEHGLDKVQNMRSSALEHLTFQHPVPAGNISIPGSASASYTFTLQSDDGAMLYIDGVLLINNTGTGVCLSCNSGVCSSAAKTSLRTRCRHVVSPAWEPAPNPTATLTVTLTVTLTIDLTFGLNACEACSPPRCPAAMLLSRPAGRCQPWPSCLRRRLHSCGASCVPYPLQRLNLTRDALPAGIHGFSPAAKATKLLTPQLHAFRVDYFQVLGRSLSHASLTSPSPRSPHEPLIEPSEHLRACTRHLPLS